MSGESRPCVKALNSVCGRSCVRTYSLNVASPQGLALLQTTTQYSYKGYCVGKTPDEKELFSDTIQAGVTEEDILHPAPAID